VAADSSRDASLVDWFLRSTSILTVTSTQLRL